MGDERERDASVRAMWWAYLASVGEPRESTRYTFGVWHFCDNQRDADELAQLVLDGVKRVTAPCIWELAEGPFPSPGDLDIVTDWSGRARCVIRTTRVEVVPFCEVSADFAAREGEGDGSLHYWRRVHRAYYERVLKPMGKTPCDDMPVVCQEFEVVWPSAAGDEG